jgi:MFS family permease
MFNFKIHKSSKRAIVKALNIVAGFFPYFLAGYFAIFILSVFFIPLKNFFFWPLVYIAIVFLALLSYISPRGKKFMRKLSLSAFYSQKNKEKIIELQFKAFKKQYLHVVSFLLANRVKIAVISLILIMVVIKGMAILEFVIMVYSVIVLFFSVKYPISFIIFVILLFFCRFLLLFKINAGAELMAVYACYFLIIAVIEEGRNLILGK